MDTLSSIASILGVVVGVVAAFFQGFTILHLLNRGKAKSSIEVKVNGKKINSSDSSAKEAKKVEFKSAWANGSFYLFVSFILGSGLGVLANAVPVYVLILILIIGIVFILLIGVLQLRQDELLSEKSFVDLLRMVVKQLPIIRRVSQEIRETHSK